MSVPDTFERALERGADADKLGELCEKVEQASGVDAAVTALGAWLHRDKTELRSSAEIKAVATRLASAYERQANQRIDHRTDALEAAFALAVEHSLDADLKVRVAVDLLAGLLDEDGELQTPPDEVLAAFEDTDHVLTALKKRARAPEIKADAKRASSYRWARLRIAEAAGDTERAFFEALGAVQKSPQARALVDELFRLALVSGRADEAVRVLADAAENFTALTGEGRGRVYNKLAALNERGLEDASAALEAYRKSLEWWPEGKAARRHATRLAEALGEAPPGPMPEASVSLPAAAVDKTAVGPGPTPPTAPLTEMEAASGDTSSFVPEDEQAGDDDDDDGFDDDDAETEISKKDSHPETLSHDESGEYGELSDAATMRPEPLRSSGGNFLVDSQTNAPTMSAPDEGPRTETALESADASDLDDAPNPAPEKPTRNVPAPGNEASVKVLPSAPEVDATGEGAAPFPVAPRPVTMSAPVQTPAASDEPHAEFGDADHDAATQQLPASAPAATAVDAAEHPSFDDDDDEAHTRRDPRIAASPVAPVAPGVADDAAAEAPADVSMNEDAVVPTSTPQDDKPASPVATSPASDEAHADAEPALPWDESAEAHHVHTSAVFESTGQAPSPDAESEQTAATPPAEADLPVRATGPVEATVVDAAVPVVTAVGGDPRSDLQAPPADQADVTVAGDPVVSAAQDASSSEEDDAEDAASSEAPLNDMTAEGVPPSSSEDASSSSDDAPAEPEPDVPAEFSTSSTDAPPEATTRTPPAPAATVVDEVPAATRALSRVPTDPFGTQVSAIRVFAEGADKSGPEAVLRELGERLVHTAHDEGRIDDDVQQQVADAALSYPDVGLQIGHRLLSRAPRELALTVPDFWLQIARVQDDVEDVFEVLIELAPYNDILAHYLDERLAGAERQGLRQKLIAAQLAASPSAEREAELQRLLMTLTPDKSERWRCAERLVLELSTDDEAVLTDVVEALSDAPPERRAPVFGRIVRDLSAPTQKAAYTALMHDRVTLGDSLGLEQAAEALLRLDDKHTDAMDVLITHWEGLRQRAQVRQDLLERRLALAEKARDEATRRKTLLTLVAHLRVHAPAERRALLEREVKARPDHRAAETALYTLLESEGDIDALIAALDGGARHGAKDERADKLKKAVAWCRREKDYDRAGALLDRALELVPDDTEALLLRAELARDGGDPQLALQSLERLAVKTPDGPERARVHYQLGQLLEESTERHSDALRRYLAAASADETYVQAWKSALDLAERIGDGDAQDRAFAGLAGQASDVTERALYYRRWGAFLRDDQDDLEGAETAYRHVVLSPARVASDMDDWFFALIGGIKGNPEKVLIEGALQRRVAPILVEVVRERPLGWPPAVVRAHALCVASNQDAASAESIRAALEHFPQDLSVLRAALIQPEAHFSTESRRDVMLRLLLRHDATLRTEEKIQLYAELALMRADDGDAPGAAKAMAQAVGAANHEGTKLSRLSDEALALGLSKHPPPDDKKGTRVRIALLCARAEKRTKSGGARDLAAAARLYAGTLGEKDKARALLERAVNLDDDAVEPREALLELDVEDGHADQVIESIEGLLARVRDPAERASLLVEKGTLLKKLGDSRGASDALVKAIELDPTNARALDEAEKTFTEQSDARGLEQLYLTQLKLLDPKASSGRISLLSRLSQVRRYDLEDTKGAIEALEAIAALDERAIKPREDAARLYAERHDYDMAMERWRQVLKLDPSRDDAWRGLWSTALAHQAPDPLYVIGEAMLLTEATTTAERNALRGVRPPFPTWPKLPSDREALRRTLEHPLERSALRSALALVGPLVRPLFAEPLKNFGVNRGHRVDAAKLPRSVQRALSIGADMMQLGEVPMVYCAELGGGEGADAPEIALLPGDTPALVMSERVVKGGMTVGRAFALGRALAWFSPHGLLASTLQAAEIKGVLEALVTLYLPEHVDPQAQTKEIATLAQRLNKAIGQNVPRADRGEVRRKIEAATRQYVHARSKLHVADWVAGVGFSADRIGFLLSGSLPAAIDVLEQTSGPGAGARIAIKELILYSIGTDHLLARQMLGLNLDADAGRRLLQGLNPANRGETL